MNEWQRSVLRSVISLLITYPLKLIVNGPLPKCSLEKLNKILHGIKLGSILHRGGKPENTIEGFRDAKTQGASTVEVDLQFTKDGHPVLLHDYTVDRTSDGTGEIKSLMLREVKTLDFGVKYGYQGARIPTLDEAVDSIKKLNLFMFLELKSVDKQGISKITEMFAKDQSLYDRIIIISFYPDIIYELRRNDPNITVGLSTWVQLFSTDENREESFRLGLKMRLGNFWIVLLLPYKEDIHLNRFDLEKYRKKGISVVTWTVNDKKEQDHFKHVLQIPYMTDNPHCHTH